MIDRNFQYLAQNIEPQVHLTICQVHLRPALNFAYPILITTKPALGLFTSS